WSIMEMSGTRQFRCLAPDQENAMNDSTLEQINDGLLTHFNDDYECRTPEPGDSGGLLYAVSDLTDGFVWPIRVTGVSRSGDEVYFVEAEVDEPTELACGGIAKRDSAGEWTTADSLHYPIRFQRWT